MNVLNHQPANVLITGARGQLGTELTQLLHERVDFRPLPTDVDELDITDADALRQFFSAHHVGYAVNCAAYTAVDRAETDPDTARRLNAEAPALLARACAETGARLVHVSTDYVFSGNHSIPYTEDDAPAPQTVYGRTKLEGERAVTRTLPDGHVIVRTAWLYSPFGNNFVKTMLRLGRERDRLTVVADQIGTPTYAADLAEGIVALLAAPQWHSGIYHYTNEGVASWYDFAVAIHRLAGVTGCTIEPCGSCDYPTPARRPHYSVLSKAKIRRDLGLHIPHWEASLSRCLERMKQTANE